MTNSVLQQLLGDASVTPESPYGTPADGPVADSAVPVESTPAKPEPAAESEFVSPYHTESEPEPVAEAQSSETPAPVEPKPENPLLPAVHALKREIKELKRELRAVKTQPSAKQEAVPEPAQVSTQPIVFNEPDPVETYLASVNGDVEAAIPAVKVREHTAWLGRKMATEQAERDRQAAVARHQQETQRREQETANTQSAREAEYGRAFEQMAEGDLSETKIGPGLGLDDVSELGSRYLTPSDKEWVRTVAEQDGAPAMWRAYYERCIERVPKHSPAGVELQARINAALAARRATAPSPTGPSAKPTVVPSKTKPTAPTRAQILPRNHRGAQTLRNMGFKW